MDDEWDLNAIVRSYTTNSSTAAATTTTAVDDYDDPFYKLPTLVSAGDDKPFSYPAFGENGNVMSGGLEEVYKEGCSQPLPPNTAVATSSVSVDRGGFVHEQLPMLRDSHSFSIHTVDRSTKRKKQQKKMVLHLTQEELSNDTWAWRKYGQKPIKGSPYPRNYYRCSTTKACGARKQVERSPMDPSIFIVSYAGEHIHPRPTHRSSLAGSTRSTKFIAVDNNKPPAHVSDNPPYSSSSPPSTSSFSPTTSLKDDESEMNDEDEDDEDILIPNTVINEELLKGFHDLKSGGGGGSF